MKRRELLKAGASSLATASLWTAGSAAAAGETPAAAGFAWSKAVAGGLVGEAFWLNHPQLRAIELTLLTMEVPEKAVPGMSQFSLVFGTRGPAFSEGTYELEQAAIGHFELHLVPAGPARYRAVFNLLA